MDTAQVKKSPNRRGQSVLPIVLALATGVFLASVTSNYLKSVATTTNDLNNRAGGGAETKAFLNRLQKDFGLRTDKNLSCAPCTTSTLYSGIVAAPPHPQTYGQQAHQYFLAQSAVSCPTNITIANAQCGDLVIRRTSPASAGANLIGVVRYRTKCYPSTVTVDYSKIGTLNSQLDFSGGATSCDSGKVPKVEVAQWYNEANFLSSATADVTTVLPMPGTLFGMVACFKLTREYLAAGCGSPSYRDNIVLELSTISLGAGRNPDPKVTFARYILAPDDKNAGIVYSTPF